MAKGWKRALEVAIARSGLARGLRTLRTPSTLILAYHNVVPEGERACGDLSLHVDQADFASQLDFLLANTQVVGLMDALELTSERHGGGMRRPRVAVTFDDAYRGAMTAGVLELEKRGLPVTVFVPPGLLGEPGFWWDAYAPEGRGLDSRFRDEALGRLGGDKARIVAWANEQGLGPNVLPEHAQPVTQSELLDAGRCEGVAFGAHTWSHPNLATLSRGRIEEELSSSKDWLVARTDRYVDVLAYPFGLRGAEAVQCASDRFGAGLLVDGGFAERRGIARHPIHETPRLNVPRGLSVDGLALRLVGFLT